jgi:hypothetical protein
MKTKQNFFTGSGEEQLDVIDYLHNYALAAFRTRTPCWIKGNLHSCCGCGYRDKKFVDFGT